LFLRNLRKTGSIAQNVNFYANLPELKVSAQNQTTEGLFKIYIQINHDYAALDLLL